MKLDKLYGIFTSDEPEEFGDMSPEENPDEEETDEEEADEEEEEEE